jgi:nucleoside-diphosphate-sugar epimerase
VIAVDRQEARTETTTALGNVLSITADLRDCALEPLLVEADTVFHLAGQPGVRTSWASGFPQYLTDNLLVTHRLAQCAAKLGTPRLILASSSSVYGPTSGTPSREDDRPNPISPYAISKLASEQLCTAHCGQAGYLTETVALRYFTVYGPGQRGDMLIHRALNAAATGEPLRIFGAGGQKRDFTYIADTVAATIAAADCMAPPSVVNVGSGLTTSLTDLFVTIAEVTGRSVPAETAPIERGDVTATLADTTRAADTLGWRARFPLAEGLAQQWASLNANFATQNQ